MLLSTSGKRIITDLGVDATCPTPTTNNMAFTKFSHLPGCDGHFCWSESSQNNTKHILYVIESILNRNCYFGCHINSLSPVLTKSELSSTENHCPHVLSTSGVWMRPEETVNETSALPVFPTSLFCLTEFKSVRNRKSYRDHHTIQ